MERWLITWNPVYLDIYFRHLDAFWPANHHINGHWTEALKLTKRALGGSI